MNEDEQKMVEELRTKLQRAESDIEIVRNGLGKQFMECSDKLDMYRAGFWCLVAFIALIIFLKYYHGW